MASKLLMSCLFSSILIYNLRYPPADTASKPDSAPDLKPADTNPPNGAAGIRSKRDLTHTGPKSEPAPASKKLGLKSKQMENRGKLLKAYAEFEGQVNDKIAFIIKNLHQDDASDYVRGEDGASREKPDAWAQAVHEVDPIVDLLLDRIGNVHEILLALIPLATYSLETNEGPAHVLHPIVWSNLNDSVNISCDSEGKSLSFCSWERNYKGYIEWIVVDDSVILSAGKTGVEGISYNGDGLAGGECGLQIKKFNLDDMGRWKCTLVTRNGGVLSGEVVIEEETQQGIYFGTAEGLKYYSFTSLEAITVLKNRSAAGVAFDWNLNKIYGCRLYEFFRCNRDGTELETVLETEEYGRFRTLAFDWITGNLYVGTGNNSGHGKNGLILACNRRQNSALTCATVIKTEHSVTSLTLNPIEGNMYWTSLYYRANEPMGSVLMGGMDGTSVTSLVALKYHKGFVGITIDFLAQRLYWANNGDNLIQSSDLRGRYDKIFAYLGDNAKPRWLAAFKQRIFWSAVEYPSRFSQEKFARIQSKTEEESQILTHYTARNTSFHHVAVGPNAGYPVSRLNHCDGHKCSTVCVLTFNSFRCLE